MNSKTKQPFGLNNEDAIEALRRLVQYIESDVIAEYESSMTDAANGIEGYNPGDDCSDLIENIGGEVLEKLIRIAQVIP